MNKASEGTSKLLVEFYHIFAGGSACIRLSSGLTPTQVFSLCINVYIHIQTVRCITTLLFITELVHAY